MKRIFFTLSSIVVSSLPLLTTVSCSNENEPYSWVESKILEGYTSVDVKERVFMVMTTVIRKSKFVLSDSDGNQIESPEYSLKESQMYDIFQEVFEKINPTPEES